MTEAQQEALERVHEILSEHFTAYAAVVEFDVVEDKETRANVSYHGGFHTALGLLDVGRRQLHKTDKEED